MMGAETKVLGPGSELIPDTDVVVENGRTFATSREPWLRFRSNEAFSKARFVEITYRSSRYDDPARPILRFRTAKGDVDRILPGPVTGVGIWRGVAPRGVRAALISPSARTGRFDFCVEDVRPVRLFEIVGLVWRKRREKLWSMLLAVCFGYLAEAENAMDWAIGAEPLENFPQWRSKRERPLDTANLDAPRSDWSNGPSYLILIDATDASEAAVARTLASLGAQIYKKFQVVTTNPPSQGQGPPVSLDDVSQDLLAGADFVAFLRAGDELLPEALATFTEEAARSPAARILYADELITRENGLWPNFKPNWSPQLESRRPYIGRCAFVRVLLLMSTRRRPDAVTLKNVVSMAALGCASSEVVHLRRWLMVRNEEAEAASSPKETIVTPARRGDSPLVSIILLTRDREDLLGPCLDSILESSTYPRFELLIVDNGTRQKKALALLEKAAEDPRVRVLMRPGLFNFAALNNDAVRSSLGEVLVFLNNDTVILTKDWLEQLSEQALDPDAGAVGALLLYPDGRIQHAGVVVGLGQDAGHFEALSAPTAPSWLDRTSILHEASAVTAACMALDRRKFDAVAGFDGQNLPIEFNDVDLCLRLAERGWPARYMPTVRVLHKESATRGNAVLRPLNVYAMERDYFRARWRAIIRDDPYFHPGLSLYSRQMALG